MKYWRTKSPNCKMCICKCKVNAITTFKLTAWGLRIISNKLNTITRLRDIAVQNRAVFFYVYKLLDEINLQMQLLVTLDLLDNVDLQKSLFHG